MKYSKITRYFCLIMVLVFAFSISGCSTKDTSTTPKKSEEISEVTSNSETVSQVPKSSEEQSTVSNSSLSISSAIESSKNEISESNTKNSSISNTSQAQKSTSSSKPAENNTTSKPTENSTSSKPAENSTSSKPAENNTASKPAENNTASKPAENNTSSKSAKSSTSNKSSQNNNNGKSTKSNNTSKSETSKPTTTKTLPKLMTWEELEKKYPYSEKMDIMNEFEVATLSSKLTPGCKYVAYMVQLFQNRFIERNEVIDFKSELSKLKVSKEEFENYKIAYCIFFERLLYAGYHAKNNWSIIEGGKKIKDPVLSNTSELVYNDSYNVRIKYINDTAKLRIVFKFDSSAEVYVESLFQIYD